MAELEAAERTVNTPASPAPRRDWFYWLLAAYAGLHLAWIAALLFDFITHPWAPDSAYGSPANRLVTVLLLAPVALGIAALVLRRAPGNVVGLCLLLWSANLLGGSQRVDSPLLPYGALNTGWIGLWMLPIYFPDGRPQPARLAKLVRGLSALLIVLSLVSPFVFSTQQTAGRTDLVNQLYVPALGPLQPLLTFAEVPVLGGTLLLILPSLLLRYRSSGAHERQQLKWLIWGFAVALAMLPIAVALGFLSTNPGQLTGTRRLIDMGLGFGLVLIPYLTVGYAILRHRLYDIDLVIRRTLVYTVLTALLALAYFGSVVVLQSTFGALTSQRESSLVTVLSTLVIAALFVPLRRQVQAFIDRRFYRRKYDATQTLAAFGASLRDETNLDQLTAHLTDVVNETMQPEAVGLWLAPAKDRMAGQD